MIDSIEFIAHERTIGAAVPVSADLLADLVVRALIDEATLTPKPGLVDIRSRGAHHDLSWSLMCDSALSLRATFYAMAQAGMQIAAPLDLREQIGQIGRDGEHCMMQITNGVNTHRGAIWALGLLVTAAAQNLAEVAPRQVAQRAASLACLDDRYAPKHSGNKGALVCQQYQVGGAKAQAQNGFPLVLNCALPVLAQSRLRGESESSARLNALLALMAKLDDTCALSRGGLAALSVVQRGAANVLAQGGAASEPGQHALKNLDADLLRLHVSPGGSADLLAAALFLDNLGNLDQNTEFSWKN